MTFLPKYGINMHYIMISQVAQWERICLQCRRPGFDPWVGKIRKWQPTPVLLPGKSHEQRSLVGYSPWGCKESDMTERLHFSFRAHPVECRTHWILRPCSTRVTVPGSYPQPINTLLTHCIHQWKVILCPLCKWACPWCWLAIKITEMLV